MLRQEHRTKRYEGAGRGQLPLQVRNGLVRFTLQCPPSATSGLAGCFDPTFTCARQCEAPVTDRIGVRWSEPGCACPLTGIDGLASRTNVPEANLVIKPALQVSGKALELRM